MNQGRVADARRKIIICVLIASALAGQPPTLPLAAPNPTHWLAPTLDLRMLH